MGSVAQGHLQITHEFTYLLFQQHLAHHFEGNFTIP